MDLSEHRASGGVRCRALREVRDVRDVRACELHERGGERAGADLERGRLERAGACVAAGASVIHCGEAFVPFQAADSATQESDNDVRSSRLRRASTRAHDAPLCASHVTAYKPCFFNSERR